MYTYIKVFSHDVYELTFAKKKIAHELDLNPILIF